jgi:hypothetical protein
VVVVLQSEETENWGIESDVAESEIMDLQPAFSAAHSADLGRNYVHARKNQHGTMFLP